MVIAALAVTSTVTLARSKFVGTLTRGGVTTTTRRRAVGRQLLRTCKDKNGTDGSAAARDKHTADMDRSIVARRGTVCHTHYTTIATATGVVCDRYSIQQETVTCDTTHDYGIDMTFDVDGTSYNSTHFESCGLTSGGYSDNLCISKVTTQYGVGSRRACWVDTPTLGTCHINSLSQGGMRAVEWKGNYPSAVS